MVSRAMPEPQVQHFGGTNGVFLDPLTAAATLTITR